MSDDHTVLSCGVRLGDLTRQVFDDVAPTDAEHQRHCPDCGAALVQIRAISADLDWVASTAVAVPPGLLRWVMARLRGAPALLTVSVSSAGVTKVAESVVVRVARDAALQVGGVEFASALPGDRAAGGRSALRVRLVVSYGPSLHELAGAVRDSVRQATAACTGVHIEHIDVSIDDLA